MILDGTTLKSMQLDGVKVKKWTDVSGAVIYTSGCTVYYYNGNTYLGSKEYQEGADVLRPSYKPTKSGYTFIGWSQSKTGNRVTYLRASGTTMVLYAVFAANSLVVASGSMNGYTYNSTLKDTSYVSGTTYVAASTSGGIDTKEASFTLYLGAYTSASLTLVGNHNTMAANQYLDGEYASNGTVVTLTAGTHTFKVNAIAQSSTAYSVLGIGTLTLSNPIAWT